MTKQYSTWLACKYLLQGGVSRRQPGCARWSLSPGRTVPRSAVSRLETLQQGHRSVATPPRHLGLAQGRSTYDPKVLATPGNRPWAKVLVHPHGGTGLRIDATSLDG